MKNWNNVLTNGACQELIRKNNLKKCTAKKLSWFKRLFQATSGKHDYLNAFTKTTLHYHIYGGVAYITKVDVESYI